MSRYKPLTFAIAATMSALLDCTQTVQTPSKSQEESVESLRVEVIGLQQQMKEVRHKILQLEFDDFVESHRQGLPDLVVWKSKIGT